MKKRFTEEQIIGFLREAEAALPRSEPPTFVCPCCRSAMIVIETLARIPAIRAPPVPSGVP